MIQELLSITDISPNDFKIIGYGKSSVNHASKNTLDFIITMPNKNIFVYQPIDILSVFDPLQVTQLIPLNFEFTQEFSPRCLYNFKKGNYQAFNKELVKFNYSLVDC